MIKEHEIKEISNSTQASIQNLEIEMLYMCRNIADLEAKNERLKAQLKECQAAKVMHRNSAKKHKKYSLHLKSELKKIEQS
jgi:hypothetical protein